MEPKVYILTLLALKTDIEGMELTGAAGASSVLTIQVSREAAESEGQASVREKYPEADGWFGHQVTVFELPRTVETDGYRLETGLTKLDS